MSGNEGESTILKRANFSERLQSELRFSFKLGDGAWKDRVIERIKLLKGQQIKT